MRSFSSITLACLLLAGQARAVSYPAASMNESDVYAALLLTSQSGGDTVVLPAGARSWLTNLGVINWPVTFQGTPGQSIIYYDNTNTAGSGVNLGLFTFVNPATNRIKRITGLTILPGIINPQSGLTQGIIQFNSTNNDALCMVDHCVFSNLPNYNIYGQGASYGLIWKNMFISTNAETHAGEFYQYAWHGGTNGDLSWTDVSGLGTSNAWYSENNIYSNYNAAAGQWTALDVGYGGRLCTRHDIFINASGTFHGADSSAPSRGARMLEAYADVFICSNNYAQAWQLRSGSGVFYSNVCWGFANARESLSAYRASTFYAYFGGATGVNPLDENADPLTPLYTGTISGVSGGVISSTGAGWTANQWVGDAFLDAASSSTLNFGMVASSSANALTFQESAFGFFPSVTIGDAFSIYGITSILDMPGMGQCTNIIARTNGAPNGPATNAVWPGQSIEGNWAWGNSCSASPSGTSPSEGVFSPQVAIILPGVHYFENATPPGYAPLTYPHPLAVIAGVQMQSFSSGQTVNVISVAAGAAVNIVSQ